jgi:segregation and condensation protein A
LEELQFKLESFEGPLDLLLKLIAKNKVEICDIPISLIFEQYMEYIERMRRMDMEIASEFLTMAAELMLIKSRMLLPRQSEEEEDPRERLAMALLEYKCMKDASVLLKEQ